MKMVADFHKQLGKVLQELGISRATTENTFKMNFLDETLHDKVAEAEIRMTQEKRQCCDTVEAYIKESMEGACILNG